MALSMKIFQRGPRSSQTDRPRIGPHQKIFIWAVIRRTRRECQLLLEATVGRIGPELVLCGTNLPDGSS